MTIIQTLSGGPTWHKSPLGKMTLGESPLYRSSDHTLHWVDCLKVPPELHILNIETGKVRILQLSDSVSVINFQAGNKAGYICAYYQGIAFLDEETGKLEVLKEIIKQEERGQKRFNDGGVDRKGRFWAVEIDITAMRYGVGKLREGYGGGKGRLWRYDPDGSLRKVELGGGLGVVCGNGVEWSVDDKVFYLNDSVGQKTYAFDFDLESGTLSNRRLLIDFAGTGGEPDGMVVDKDGNLWIIVYGTNRLMVFDPQGTKLKEIVFSGKKLTCPTWGGKDFNTLFITSASDGNPETEGGDEGGHVFNFKVEGGHGGGPKFEFAG